MEQFLRISIPVLVSDRGYGVLFNCACLMVFDNTEQTCKITFSFLIFWS